MTRLSLFVVFAAIATLGTACGSSSSAGGTGGAGGGAGGQGGGTADTARYNFETSTQNWGGATDAAQVFTSVMTSTAQHFAGSSSLAAEVASIGATASPYALETVFAPAMTIPPSTTLTFHIWIPAGAPIGFVQPYVLEDAVMSYRFTGHYLGAGAFTAGAWTSVDVVTPADVTPILKVGVQFTLTDTFTGTFYVDSVNW